MYCTLTLSFKFAANIFYKHFESDQSFRMNAITNETTIIPTTQQREAAVNYSNSYWKSLFDVASSYKQLPSIPDFTQSLRQVPSFAATRHKACPTQGPFLLTKGTLAWSTTEKHDCRDYSNLKENDDDVDLGFEYFNLPKAKTYEQSFLLGIKNASRCRIDQNHRWATWPGEEGELDGQGNFVTALTLAWAYILSSVWARVAGWRADVH
jgi:hypothetical protein